MKERLLKEITFTTSRSSGPGGQHVNKTESKVSLHWKFMETTALTEEEKVHVARGLKSRLSETGELILSSQKSRSQLKNKEDVTERFLALIIKLSKPRKQRIRTKPSKASIERRLKEKKAQGEKKRSRGKPGQE